jgi:hypothetical protein
MRVAQDSSTVGGVFSEFRKGHAAVLLLLLLAGAALDAAEAAAAAAVVGTTSCGVMDGAGPVADA